MSWIKNLPSLRLLGNLLIEKGKITKEQLDEALEYQKQKGIRLGVALAELGYITEADVLDVFSQHLEMPRLQHLDRRVLDGMGADYSFISEFPIDTISRLGVIPFKLEIETQVDQVTQIWKFHVILSDPWMYDEVSMLIDNYVKQYFASHDIGVSIYDVETEIVGYLAESSEIGSILAEISGTVTSSIFNRDEEQAAGKLFYDIMTSDRKSVV